MSAKVRVYEQQVYDSGDRGVIKLQSPVQPVSGDKVKLAVSKFKLHFNECSFELFHGFLAGSVSADCRVYCLHQVNC